MRFLKKFNENYEGKEELLDFCETYLAYLLDENFFVRVDEYKDYYLINLHKIIRDKILYYNWNEISNSFIPFLKFLYNEYDSYGNKCIILNNSYGETNIYVFNSNSKYHELDMKKIDNIPIRFEKLLNAGIYSIEIKIKK